MGKVVDAKNNMPLISASVNVVGASRGIETDFNGNFSIEVEKGTILKFSFYGYYSKEVEVLNDSYLVIELKDNYDPITHRENYIKAARRLEELKHCRQVNDSLRMNLKNQNNIINH